MTVELVGNSDSEVGSPPEQIPRVKPRQWAREESVAHSESFEAAVASDSTSQRQWANDNQVPRSTLQYWLGRKRNLDSSPELIAFFESSTGLAFLHRLVIVLLLVFSGMGSHGRRRVGLALKLAGLEPFVATSNGSLQELGVSMEDELAAYEKHCQPSLAAQMEPKPITLCEDETFHPQICLVAIEPVSNFIVLEKYAEKRDAATWTAELSKSLEGLPVRVIQSTSDEGSGLLGHVKRDLGAHHSPDLFHCQHEVSKGTSIALAAQTRKAEQAVADALVFKEKLRQNERKWHEDFAAGGQINIPDFTPLFAKADADQKDAQHALETAHTHQECAKKAIRGLGDDYHPIDLLTGALLKPEEVGRKLEEHLDNAETVAREAGLGDRCLKSIAKARRLLPAMVNTLVFFSIEVASYLAGLGFTPSETSIVYEYLLPLAYLERIIGKARDAASRERLRDLITRLQQMSPAIASTLALLPAERQALIAKAVTQCVDLFQRASSCTEGRNGQLSLYHHGLHKLSNRKLHALTVLHNYFILRPDGTTAAERFFGKKPPDLFEWLLDRLAMPARPRPARTELLSRAS